MTRYSNNEIREISDILLVEGSLFLGGISKISHGEHQELLNGYGSDVALPFTGYYLLDFFWSNVKPFRHQAEINAGIWFTGCCTHEILQGAGVFDGRTFDWKDFIAYGVGVGLAYGIDKLRPKKKSFDDTPQ